MLFYSEYIIHLLTVDEVLVSRNINFYILAGNFSFFVFNKTH